MTDKQPDALRLAGLLELAPEDGVEPQTTEDAAAELRRQHAENETLHVERERNLNSIRVCNEIINKKNAELESLTTGYAAARLEIESLQARIKTLAEERSDELAVAHLDWRMRVAQPAEAQQPAPSAAPATTEGHGRTDAEIVAQTVELTEYLLSWKWGLEPEGDTSRIWESKNTKVLVCWNAACHIQDLLTQTDVWNAVAELDGQLAPTPQADSVTAPAATVIKKGADRQWMSERLGHLPDGIYSLYLAPPAQTADSVLEDAERYRWLRRPRLAAGQGSITVELDDRANGHFSRSIFLAELDAAIDAARAAQEGK